jgi:chemotaxis protein MotA
MGFVGIIIVFAGVIGGFLAHEGPLHVLWQPTEMIIIFGAALGGAVISAPLSTIKMCVKQSIHCLTGKGPSKQDYTDLMQMLFRVFQTLRKDGPQAIEKHIEDPAKSEIFKAYPNFLKNHHAVHFICDTLKVNTMLNISLAVPQTRCLVSGLSRPFLVSSSPWVS